MAVLAPMINTVQSVPQLLHIWREKTVDGLSIHSIYIMILVEILWFVHGYFIWDYSLMISSSMLFLVNLGIIASFIRNRTVKN